MADFDLVAELFGEATADFGYYAKARNAGWFVDKDDLVFAHCNIITDVV